VRGSVVGSALVHLGLLGVLFVARPARTIVIAGPDVVQVSLVDPAAMPIVAAPPPAPAPKPEPAAVQPSEDEGVKLEPPKPKPREKPQEQTPPRAANLPDVQLPYAAVGNSGLRGAVAVDDANFEFAYYLTLVRNRIAANWAPPAGLTHGGEPVRAVLYFRIHRDGRIDATRLETGSGVEFFDRSAVRAVTLSDPLPPLPLGYSGSDLGVHFGFEYLAP
jgi:TonB family protein